jgi:uncharacterized protein (DUF1501 family)
MHASRRHFLRTASLLGAATGPAAAPLALSLAGLASLAQAQTQNPSSANAAATTVTSNPYKALVCVFLNGGNDANNWVVPTDIIGYGEYLRARSSLALPSTGLLPMSGIDGKLGSGRSFGMAPVLAPLHQLYENRRLAVLANIGTLDWPLTRAEFQADLKLPSRLFSHNDQQNAWQAMGPEGVRSGWGGRLADALMAANAQPTFTTVSASGNAVFLAGQTVQQYQVGLGGPTGVQGLTGTSLLGSSTAKAALQRVLVGSNSNSWERDYSRLMQQSLDAEAALRTGLAQVTVPAPSSLVQALPGGGTYQPSTDGLARQFHVVARIIAAQAAMGMQRQVFMVTLGGFDTHANQLKNHANLSHRVAQAMAYFDTTLQALGMGDNVTTFTASDFGRTLVSNGDGSDHGWGSHHLVMGGAVRGGTVYGRMPGIALATPEDLGGGRMLPSMAVAQLAGRLGSWMGVPTAQLNVAIPTLSRFDAAPLAGLL